MFLFFISIILVAILFMKYLSWDTNNIVPVNSFSDSSSISLVSISMWLVGSSRIKKLYESWIRQNIFNLTFSPPDKYFIFLWMLSPTKRYLNKALLKYCSGPMKYFLASSSTDKLISSNSISWGM